MENHLGTGSELNWFAMKMAEELENHIKEKISLRNVSFGEVRGLVISEVSRRMDIIKNLDTSQDDIEKQCVHIANYIMMLFLRSKYNV
ncbi:MAG: hypothetical protein AABY07_00525 [Nanoarchaeota archaeon]